MGYEISSLLEIESSFVPIDDFKAPPPYKQYVKGVIRWRIEQAVIDMDDDMIDYLWCSIIEGLLNFKREGHCDVLFPSQPFSLRFSKVGKNAFAKELVRITIGECSVVAALSL